MTAQTNTLEALIAKLLADSLSEQECHQLETLLQDNPKYREIYVQQIWFDTFLQANYQDCVVPEFLVSNDEDRQAVSETSVGNREATNVSLFWRWVVVIAASVLLIGWLVLPGSIGTPVAIQEPVDPARDELPVDSGYVAMLLDSEDLVWDQPQALACGARLKQGDVLRIKSGQVRLRFDCGAGVVLEGPASLELTSAWNANLRRGKLAAVVPDGAEGFTIFTPSTRIVDLGTEFGASVDESGHADIQVFDGRVEVHSRSTPRSDKVVRLVAGSQPRFTQKSRVESEVNVAGIDSREKNSVPSPEQLTAASHGIYPPSQRSDFGQVSRPARPVPALIDDPYSIPSSAAVGEDFFPISTAIDDQGSSHPWVMDPKFARIVYLAEPLSWASVSGGHDAMELDGRDPAFPFIANRLQSKLEQPLSDDFYFSLLGRYTGLDDDDFFSLWFDDRVDQQSGEGLSHSTQPNAGIRFGEYFARVDMGRVDYHGHPKDQATFFLIGQLRKDTRDRFSEIRLWVNPTSKTLGHPDASVPFNEGNSLSLFSYIGVRMGKNTELQDKLLLDRIVLGSTLADVFIPEAVAPATPPPANN